MKKLTAEQQQQLDLVERDRKDREALIFLLLLALSEEAYQNAIITFRTGGDIEEVVRQTFVTGGTPILRNAYEGAYRDAVRTANEIAGDSINPGPPPTPPPGLDATTVIDGMADDLVRRIQPAIDSAHESIGNNAPQGVITSDDVTSFGDAIKEAMQTGGFLHDNNAKGDKPYELWTVGITIVNSGYQPGLFNTWQHSKNVFGYQFCAILDDRTTAICEARDGVKLYKDDYWWWTNFCPCHWNCRSSILALLSPFIPTKNPPVTPPVMAGFGIAPPEFRALSRNYEFKRPAMLSRLARASLN